MLTVGTTGGRWLPRPVEIAVVTDNGDEVSTVVNPTPDLFSARDEFGITTRDVQLAPLLTEAWPALSALSALLARRVPVGVDIDRQLAHLLEGTWQRVLSPDHEVLERLRGVEEHFGVRVLPEGFEATGPISAADVLVPGARVCFSGTVHSPRHGWLEKEQLHAMAEARGLRAVPTLTKTRTDVLVVAEAGSQSSKAKNAARWEKPVITAEEFLEWVG